MSIIRDLPQLVPSMLMKAFVTCSCQVANLFTSGIASSGTTGYIITATSGGTLAIEYGRIIDRLGSEIGGARFAGVIPFTIFESTVQTTGANRQITINADLQHGDSSGGGDMADYSTQAQPDDKVFFTSARTTSYTEWTTEAARLQSNQSYYDLRAAKRYIRAVHTVDKCEITTESTGWEGGRLSGTIALLGGNTPKEKQGTGFGSTSTST